MMNTWLRRIAFGGLFLVPFIPLVINEGLFFPFITGKNFAFRVIIEIVFAAWLLLAFRDPSARPRKSPILFAVGAFLLILAVADAFGENPFKSFWSNYERMEGLIAHLHFGAYFLVLTSLLKTETLWRRFFHSSLAVTFFLSIYGILQHFGAFAINQGNIRVDAMLGNAIYIAVFLLFHLFITALYFFKAHEKELQELALWALGGAHLILLGLGIRWFATGAGGSLLQAFLISGAINVVAYLVLQKKHVVYTRFLYAQFFLLQLYVLYRTATRGAILGVVLGAIAAALFVGVSRQGKLRTWTFGFVGIIAALVIVFIGIKDTDFVTKSPVLNRFRTFNETTVVSRAYIWQLSFEGFKERPVLGWGQENYNIVFNKYYDPRLYGQEQWFDRAHNVFLDWLISAGILGLLSYLALFGSAVYLLLHPHKNDFPLEDRAILFGMLLGYFAQNVTVFDNLTSYILFFSFLAYIHVRAEGSLKTNALFGDARMTPERQRIAAGFVGLVTLFVVYGVNIIPLRASTTLIQGLSPQRGGAAENLALLRKSIEIGGFGVPETREQIVQFALQAYAVPEVPQPIKDEIGTFAAEQIEAQIKDAPTDARYHFFASGLYQGMARYEDAYAQLVEAIQLSPKKQPLIFELGALFLSARDYPKALEAFKAAYDLDQSFVEARINYALGAIYAGDYKLAESLLVPQFGTIAIDDNRILRAFVARKDYAKAIEIWQGRVSKNPENARFRAALGVAYHQAKQTNKALVELRAALQMDPTLKEAIETETGLKF